LEERNPTSVNRTSKRGGARSPAAALTIEEWQRNLKTTKSKRRRIKPMKNSVIREPLLLTRKVDCHDP